MQKNLQEESFTELRSKLQLGYDVQLKHTNNFGCIGFELTVISEATKHTVRYKASKS